MLNFNISKVAYFHEPLIIQTTETIPSSSKCHSAISGLTLPLPAWADVWMWQLNFPFNISFFYQYWYKRSVLRLFKTDYGDSLSAERISLQQRWCSGKLSACLPWYTYCQVSTIFASEFRRKKVGVKKIFSITYSFKLALKKSLLLWSVIKYPCSLQEQTLFNFEVNLEIAIVFAVWIRRMMYRGY